MKYPSPMRSLSGKLLFITLATFLAWTLHSHAAPALLPTGAVVEAGKPLLIQPTAPLIGETATPLYLALTYVDNGYGKIDAQLMRGGKGVKPDRYLGLTRMNTGGIVTARMRFPASVPGPIAVRIGIE